MRINHFLPFFFCSVILLFLCPPSKSPLHHIVLSFCSASSLSFCSASSLSFCSAFALSFCSASTLHFITFWTSSIMSNHACPSYCLILFPFRTANHIQSHSFSFIHPSFSIPLPLPIGNTRTSVLATETLTDLSTSVHFS
jgi:hypothetical protein